MAGEIPGQLPTVENPEIKFGGIRIQEKLGSGPISEGFMGLDQQEAQLFLEILMPQLASDPSMIDLFRQSLASKGMEPNDSNGRFHGVKPFVEGDHASTAEELREVVNSNSSEDPVQQNGMKWDGEDAQDYLHFLADK